MRRKEPYAKKFRWWGTVVLALVLVLSVLPVLAQTGGLFDLSWNTIGGGGGSSSGGDYALGGTVGQPDAGVSAGGGFTLGGGFWSGGQVVENQPPTDIQLSNHTITEGLPSGTLVGTLTTTDPDVGDTFTYALVSGDGNTGNSAFDIDGDQLVSAIVFDYATQNTYSVRISTTDSGGLSYEEAFTINVEPLGTPGNKIYLPLIMR
jgi:hypothetical protein